MVQIFTARLEFVLPALLLMVVSQNSNAIYGLIVSLFIVAHSSSVIGMSLGFFPLIIALVNIHSDIISSH